jgi:hypothetical protein
MTIFKDCPAIRASEELLPASGRTGSAQKKCLTKYVRHKSNSKKTFHHPKEEEGAFTLLFLRKIG